MIQSVNSNTSITLDKPFAETTVSNSNYRILLNTAAHFPSDTAAKVERALEQLSDINEAAINNDRTVTAATYINGKGLTNTTGDLNVYSNSVNANNGGRIQFHYNQSSNATAKIWESEAGLIRLDGNMFLNGRVQNTFNIDSSLYLRHSILKGDVPSEISNRSLWFGGSSSSTGYSANCLGMLANEISTSNNVCTYMRAMKNEASNSLACTISVNVDANGNTYTYAPTPATTDNSTKIATTAFVNNRLPYETGTWTPVLKGYTTAGAFTYSTVMGYYVKIGTLVYINAAFNVTCTTAPAGSIRIYGLPFTAHQYTNGGNILVNETSNDSLVKARFCRVQDSNTFMAVYGEDLSNSFRKCSQLIFSSSDTTGVNVACDVNSTLSMRIAGVYYSNT